MGIRERLKMRSASVAPGEIPAPPFEVDETRTVMNPRTGEPVLFPTVASIKVALAMIGEPRLWKRDVIDVRGGQITKGTLAEVTSMCPIEHLQGTHLKPGQDWRKPFADAVAKTIDLTDYMVKNPPPGSV